MDDVSNCSMRLRTLLAAALATMCLNAVAARAAEIASCCCNQQRPQDEVWLVSDRGLGCCVERDVERLRCWRYDCQQGWTPANLEELLTAGDPEMVTAIYVHGNQMAACEAFGYGVRTYRALVGCADERPVRFVTWSWPSDRVARAAQDVRIKAARTNLTAYYLAWFIDRLNPQVPVSLWGHSFGARASSGALHLLGGGVLSGRSLERVHPDRPAVQTVLMAAALDCDWLFPGRFHGQALSQMSELLLVNNGCDRLLKRYHWLYHRRSCAEALGYTGLYRGRLPADEQAKIEQINACCIVGQQHKFLLYLASGSIMARVRATMLDEVAQPERSGPELVQATTTTDEAPVE
jgi:hypothetical protein